MRNLRLLDAFRETGPEIVDWFGSIGDHETGMFAVPSTIDKVPMKVIASVAHGWDHVSVSRQNRCPLWPEMEQIKRLFFKEDEVAMQLHVPPKDHISVHPYCLHLWRPLEGQIPTPPSILVA